MRDWVLAESEDSFSSGLLVLSQTVDDALMLEQMQINLGRSSF
jgi:hypothetical protein